MLSETRNRSVPKLSPADAVKWAVPVSFIFLYFLFSRSKDMASLAVMLFSRPIRDIMGTICSLFPFSVMELCYAAVIIYVIIHIIRTVIIAIKSDRKLPLIIKRLSVLILIALYILASYLCLYGIDYQSYSFSEKEDFSVSGVTADQLYDAADYFITNAIGLADTVRRDDNGHFAEDRNEYFPISVSVYDELQTRFPTLCAETRVPKAMVFSRIMSRMGFAGIYFPMLGESNINVDAPACFIPFTIAHELAHQRGVYSEQECNFLGVAACVTSDIPVYTYSGYLSGSLYLMNALYRADPQRYYLLKSRITGDMLTDWRDNNEYWASMESTVTTVSEKVYDTYLKANGQDMGMQSYGACVDHLVAYFVSGGFEK